MNNCNSTPTSIQPNTAHAEVLDLPDADILIYRGFLGPDDAQATFDALDTGLEWGERPFTTVWGRTGPIPRDQAFCGDKGIDYRYSQTTIVAAAWIPPLELLRDLAQPYVVPVLTAALCNRYVTGSDKVGMHADKDHGKPVDVIASYSLGATRPMRLKRSDRTGRTVTVELRTGDLMLMAGDTQHHWMHEIPPYPAASGPRINVTLRAIEARTPAPCPAARPNAQ
jgi:alkylated DNA repair dioxygenase AlkB